MPPDFVALAENFYPRPLRGGRPFFNGFGIPGYLISIHALCEEGDGMPSGTTWEAALISIHALCVEGDVSVSR